jgi:inosine-uridine nucleoside N-ribohydrolase
MVRLANARPGELTVVAVGPLTNLAIALNVEPRLPELIKSLVIMGGAFQVPGNTSPAAEFNIVVDPEAAAQVFAGFPNLTAIGLDVTERVGLSKQDWSDVVDRTGLRPAAALFGEVGAHAFANRNIDQFHLHDPLAMMVAIDPGLVRSEEATVVVDLDDANLGRTRIVGPGSTHVAVEVDVERALAEFRRVVGLSVLTA